MAVVLLMLLLLLFGSIKTNEKIDYLVTDSYADKVAAIKTTADGIETGVVDTWSIEYIQTSMGYCNDIFPTEELRLEYGIIDENGVDSCQVIEDYLNEQE